MKLIKEYCSIFSFMSPCHIFIVQSLPQYFWCVSLFSKFVKYANYNYFSNCLMSTMDGHFKILFARTILLFYFLFHFLVPLLCVCLQAEERSSVEPSVDLQEFSSLSQLPVPKVSTHRAAKMTLLKNIKDHFFPLLSIFNLSFHIKAGKICSPFRYSFIFMIFL